MGITYLMNRKIYKYHLSVLLIIIIAILVRLPNINAPIIDAHAWRQTLTATIAKNFVLEDSNILHPKQSEILPELNFERYVFLEFPLYQYSVSLLYRMFGIFPWVPRLVTIIFAILSSLGIYKIGTILFSKSPAPLIAALMFHFFPVSHFYGRAVLPDMTMVAFLVACLFFLLRYTQTLKIKYVFIASVFLSIAVIIKPYSLIYIFLFPLVLFITGDSKKKFSIKHFMLMASATSVTILPYTLWFFYFMNSFPQAFPKEHMQGMVGWGNTTFEEFKKQMWTNFSYELFTTPGSLMIGAGLLLILSGAVLSATHRLFLLVWTACGVLYILIVASGNVHHHYYQLPLVPLATLYLSAAIDFLINLTKRFNKNYSLCIGLGLSLLILVVIYSKQFVNIARGNYYSSVSYYSEISKVKKVIPEKSFIIVSGYFRDPTFLDLAERKGWPFNSEILEEKRLSDEFSQVSIPESILPFEDIEYLKMPDEGYYKYLIPFIDRKKNLGAEYIVLLRREMPTSFASVTNLINKSHRALYISDEVAVFKLLSSF